MLQNQLFKVSSYLLILLTLTSLACSSLSGLTSQEETALRPTRAPLPTFTPTPPIEALLSVPPTPTQTPIPPPTDPPPPQQEASPTDTPEPAPTDTPEPAPTDPPPPPPPAEPAPTDPPPPPAGPVADGHGVIGKIDFRDGRNTYAVGEKVFVKIEAENTAPGLLPFGILGLTTSTGGFQTSWSEGTIASGETFRHEDGMPFPVGGSHKMWLSICFSSQAECQGPNGDWTRFEPGLDVIVQ